MRLITVLSIAVLCNALAVVYVRQENRDVFKAVVTQETQRDQLNTEWSQLQLEQATWAQHSRVELVARYELKMLPPSLEDIVVVRLPGDN